MAEVKETPVWLILTVVIIVVMAAIVFIFFNRIYPQIRGEELSPETKEEAMGKFDQLIINIKACRDVNDTNCLCEGFPTWPGVFPSGSLLTMKDIKNGKEIEINLSYRKKIIRSDSIANVKFVAMSPDKKKILSYATEKSISFEQEPPLWIQAGEIRKKSVVSSYLYKEKDILYFIINYGRELIDAEEKMQISKCKIKTA